MVVLGMTKTDNNAGGSQMTIDIRKVTIVVAPPVELDGHMRGLAHAAIIDAGKVGELSTDEVLDYFYAITGLLASVDGPLTYEEEVQYMAEAVDGMLVAKEQHEREEELGRQAYLDCMTEAYADGEAVDMDAVFKIVEGK